jgi:hypothetical protein
MLDNGRLEEALHWAEEALRHDSAQETAAAPLAHVIRFRLGRGREHLDALNQFWRDHPGHAWGGRVMGHLRPYEFVIPEPGDAGINLARQFLQERLAPKKPPQLKVTMTSTEAPSVLMAVEAALNMPRGSLELVVLEIPVPDPRVPRGPVDYLLWRYEGNDPHPALPPPPAEIATAVAELAQTQYDLERWTHQARDIARRLGPGAVEGLLATMVHPPPMPSDPTGDPPARDESAWNWIRHVQFAAALMLAGIDDGWEGSTRRKAPASLARGPVDWPTEAAAVALSQVCREPGLPRRREGRDPRLPARPLPRPPRPPPLRLRPRPRLRRPAPPLPAGAAAAVVRETGAEAEGSREGRRGGATGGAGDGGIVQSSAT